MSLRKVIAMGIVEKIKKLCDDHSTNFAELERRVGLSNGQIRRWDKVSPKTDSIQKVADYFHVSIDYLLGRKEQSEHTETDLAKMVDSAMSFDGKPINEHDREVILAFLKGKYGIE